MDRASGALSAELHYLFRQSALVRPAALRAGVDCGGGRNLPGLAARHRIVSLLADRTLLRRPVSVLHGLSWRAVPAASGAGTIDRLLPADCGRRGVRRIVRRRTGAAHFPRLLRTALGAVRVRRFVCPEFEPFSRPFLALARVRVDAG